MLYALATRGDRLYALMDEITIILDALATRYDRLYALMKVNNHNHILDVLAAGRDQLCFKDRRN